MLPRLPAPVVSVCLERPWKDVSAARVHAVLQEQWESIDADAPSMMRELQAPAFAEFSHARDTFRTHLIGTFATLGMWMQPDPVLRCGLFHTAYGGDLFRFHAWNGEDESHRARVRRIIGREAESLVWLFGTLRRGELIGLEGMMRGDARPAPQMSHSMLASHWSGARVNVSVDDREDIHSSCLSALDMLFSSTSISPNDVGRLEVGTETLMDTSICSHGLLFERL